MVDVVVLVEPFSEFIVTNGDCEHVRWHLDLGIKLVGGVGLIQVDFLSLVRAHVDRELVLDGHGGRVGELVGWGVLEWCN